MKTIDLSRESFLNDIVSIPQSSRIPLGTTSDADSLSASIPSPFLAGSDGHALPGDILGIGTAHGEPG